jgi:LysR family glycine cleavage system transcriptional activator
VKSRLRTNRDSCGNASAKVSRGRHRQLPPLNAVRAFEAAARAGGFQAAGVELHVSANAVGRLVKVLEDWLGVPLFKRLARGVALTEAGRSYLARVGALLDQLADATADVQRSENAETLTISATPSFVARWLVPRLGRLGERVPGIDVRLEVSVRLADFAREKVDVAIRYRAAVGAELHSELLMREDLSPVCSPALLACNGPLRELSDLSEHILLHYEPRQPVPYHIGWARWLAAVGAEDIDAERGPNFFFSHLALQAAAAGQGVALGSSPFIGDDLAAGRLVKPFGDLSVRSPHSFFIVCPPATANSEKIAAFRNWVLEEAASFGS